MSRASICLILLMLSLPNMAVARSTSPEPIILNEWMSPPFSKVEFALDINDPIGVVILRLARDTRTGEISTLEVSMGSLGAISVPPAVLRCFGYAQIERTDFVFEYVGDAERVPNEWSSYVEIPFMVMQQVNAKDGELLDEDHWGEVFVRLHFSGVKLKYIEKVDAESERLSIDYDLNHCLKNEQTKE